MTTESAARLYEAQHSAKLASRKNAVFNPNDKPVESLPIIYGFNNGGSPGWMQACLIAEDGTQLGGHVCTSEAYMKHDLGILEGTRPDRHENDFKKHYPDGYRMEFVRYSDIDRNEKLVKAIGIANAKDDEAE